MLTPWTRLLGSCALNRCLGALRNVAETAPVIVRLLRRPCRSGPASLLLTSQLGVSGCGVRRPRLVLRTLAQQIELLLGVEFAGLRGTQEVPQDLDEADGLLHVGVVTHPLHHLQPAVGDGLVR